MKKLELILKNSAQSKYRALAEALRVAIQSGKIKPGEVLPSSRGLALQLKMNRHTVMNALSELQSEGWILSHEKRNYQVVETLPSTFLKSRSTLEKEVTKSKRAIRFTRQVEIADHVSEDQFKRVFRSGLPDLRLFPVKELKSFLSDALKSAKTLDYGDPTGHRKLIAQIETYLRRVRSVWGREIIVTNGSQESIFLLAQMLIEPGDFVAVESLGYPPANEALKFAGGRLLSIEVDHEGMNVDALEMQLNTRKVKLIYITPLHQFPTTSTLSASRRLKLYELAYKYNVKIIEDDYDHEFHYASQPVAPLAAFDPAGLVLYVSTFSKTLYPSARIGFMAVSKEVKKEVVKLKRITSRQNDQVLQDAISRWMESGGFERHLRKMRRVYEERRNSFVSTLTQLKEKHRALNWTTPSGGMALWLDTGSDSSKLAVKARKEGILIFPEESYRLDGKAGSHLRLGFSAQTTDENRQALFALSRLLG